MPMYVPFFVLTYHFFVRRNGTSFLRKKKWYVRTVSLYKETVLHPSTKLLKEA